MAKGRHDVLTIHEAVTALTALEPRAARARDRRTALSSWQLRYLATHGCLSPGRAAHSLRGVYVFRVDDLVLLRLMLRIASVREAWQARSAVAYLGPALREAIARQRAVAVVFVDGARAELLPLSAPHAQIEDAFSIPACIAGVEMAMRREIRKRGAELWNGVRKVSARELAHVVEGSM